MRLPHEARIAVVLRRADVVVATGETVVEAGDRPVVFAPSRAGLVAELEGWVAEPILVKVRFSP